MDEYALAAQGPYAHDVAQQLIDGLGWTKQARIRAGALPTHARIVNVNVGVWLGVTSGPTVQLYAGRVDTEAASPYRDPVPGTESGELSPHDEVALIAAARAVLDRVTQAKR
ncbi:hypothetical protein [Streptomyces violaceusniger]|uniref:Uncharacterized protein n=1 Tax=Streptomyces violaceusniger TaxID=68280 RepID=A0A4D4LJB8_STRVO|nr:hypothetical protein SVIO_111770 [Streptomyces violaceusniger]